MIDRIRVPQDDAGNTVVEFLTKDGTVLAEVTIPKGTGFEARWYSRDTAPPSRALNTGDDR